ncbi:MAG TPA: GPR endopeptidase [Levilinea sp.]|nr:GPR endopeptidase [Levilinea sp.]
MAHCLPESRLYCAVISSGLVNPVFLFTKGFETCFGAGREGELALVGKLWGGIPVFSIGVPTVVDAITIAGDSFDHIAEGLKKESPQGNVLAGIVQKMEWQEKKDTINEILNPYTGDLIVTPKEIDALIEDISLILAGSLDAAFHPQKLPR